MTGTPLYRNFYPNIKTRLARYELNWMSVSWPQADQWQEKNSTGNDPFRTFDPSTVLMFTRPVMSPMARRCWLTVSPPTRCLMLPILALSANPAANDLWTPPRGGKLVNQGFAVNADMSVDRFGLDIREVTVENGFTLMFQRGRAKASLRPLDGAVLGDPRPFHGRDYFQPVGRCCSIVPSVSFR